MNSRGADGTPTAGALSRSVRTKPKVDLVVGLDFGTSSTKVAYRELGATAKSIKPLFFNHHLKAYPSYCLPSVGLIAGNGRLVWGADAVRALEKEPWNSGIRRLKVLVAGERDAAFTDAATSRSFQKYINDTGADPEILRPATLAAVAIAKQMHLVRSLLRSEYPRAELDLRFNVCIPIDHMERSGVMEHYHRIHHVAERLYHEWTDDGWDAADLLEAANSLFDGATGSERSDGRVFAVPEAMAQVASYVTSLESKQGIHAVLDIGAGTSDLSIFNLVGPNTRESRCYWYAARNFPQGSGHVEAEIVKVLGSRNPYGPVTEMDVFQALEAATERSQVGKAVEAALTSIWRKLRHTWAAASRNHFRRQSAWSNVPVFLCGGGSKLPGVASVFSRSWVPNWPDFVTRRLPVPDDYDGHRGKAPFARLSVAYGLTYLRPELGDFKLPSDSPDHTPEVRLRLQPNPLSDGEPG